MFYCLLPVEVSYALLMLLIVLNLATKNMYMVTHMHTQSHFEHKLDPWCMGYNLSDLSNVHIIPAGSRLSDFKIMVGVKSAKHECASVSGK